MAKDKKKLPKGKPETKLPLPPKGKHPIPQNGNKFQMKNQRTANSSMTRRGSARGR